MLAIDAITQKLMKVECQFYIKKIKIDVPRFAVFVFIVAGNGISLIGAMKLTKIFPTRKAFPYRTRINLSSCCQYDRNKK